MTNEIRDELLKKGLDQATTPGLKRLSKWRGKMLLDGEIFYLDKGKGIG